jgi:hypothetical protein
VNIDVYRLIETDRSIIGRLAVNGIQFCFTLEPSRFKPIHAGHPCIPVGLYSVKLSLSPHFGYVTPEVLDVPGRSAIRVHRGNKPEDSLGCTLVGEEHSQAPDWISNSHQAFDRLMEACKAAEAKGEQITVEYHDPATQGSS